jgi:hypothetical protein
LTWSCKDVPPREGAQRVIVFMLFYLLSSFVNWTVNTIDA